ncbi:acetolactate synthase small subunit [Schaalia sp. ZJ405]|uniref:acetolactate synthase small subunit n=1 Tax=Schaalia sp. ZJ405 TaxID=2709403 RepID=UPI0013EC12D2|nr:acetolactate synthase small subunit [Schaalia sp. ZJ405]QPK81819.1 acetolactate synthase small subunit [Schaalia sp. ZJ405]
MAATHTLAVLVENKPGVLTRVAALFARRAFNIKSLAVGETEHPEVSRMTIIVEADEQPFEQVTKQLNKLINVLKVVEHHPEDSVERRMILFKVRADDQTRTNVLQIVDLFRAHIVDVHTESVVIESIGSLSKLEALLRALEPYGITEIVQSGAVAIGRGSRSITDQLKEK